MSDKDKENNEWMTDGWTDEVSHGLLLDRVKVKSDPFPERKKKENIFK
jgi:hypothetical protein